MAQAVIPGGSGTRYYTFAPGKAPAARKGDEIKLAPGQTLHFAAGRGYYAGPARPAQPRVPVGQLTGTPGYGGGFQPGTRRPINTFQPGVGLVSPLGRPGGGGGGGKPTPPVDPYGAKTPAQIEAQAEAIARGQLLPQQQEIRRQQALAAAQAASQYGAIQGYNTAAAGMEGAMAPAVESAYSTATHDVGQLGQGLSTDISQDVAAGQAADQAQAAAQGIATQDTINTSALHDTMYGITGITPGTSLAARGAASATEAAGVPQVQLNAGRQELDSAMADARTKNDDYAQQLIQVAAQFPGLKAQALATLNQYELDKAKYRESVSEFNRTYALQTQAELATEAAAGLKGQITPYQAKSLALRQQQINNQYKIQKAGLRFKNNQAAAKATAEGKIINVPASKLLGHVVYKDGSEDTSIKVAKDLGAGQGSAATRRARALKDRGAALTKASTSAFTEAQHALGTPVKAGKPRNQYAPSFKGVYKAASWAKGPKVFSDGTTNDPHFAARTGRASGWAALQNELWGKIGGDQLMARYGLSHQQVLSLINRAMTRAGWNRKFAGG